MEDQLFKLLTLFGVALVALAQSVFIAFKVVAKKAEKKNGNPGSPNNIVGKHKMCFDHDKDIALNQTNIVNLAGKIDDSFKQNKADHKVMFKKLDDLKG